MDFLFIFYVFWIVLSRERTRNLLTYTCIVFTFLCSTTLSSDEPDAMSEDFLLKSHKIIEAVPKVLRRSHSSSFYELPDGWDCETVGACNDLLGYEAIRNLHRQLDDDANGSIDVAESDEFLRDELQYENGYERHKEFHGNDKYINVDELWQVWKVSEVHNWTIDDTVEWLITYIDLPQYEHSFRNNVVDGTCLPRLAININNYMSSLGIKDPIHKQKIALKAMDIVLFGPPRHHNYLKDCLLGLSLLIATGGCWFAYVQHKYSQTHMQKMMKDMDTLQKAEDALLDLQKELNKAKHMQEKVCIEKQDLERRLQDEVTAAKQYQVQPSGDGSDTCELIRVQELEKQLQVARNDLREAEKKLEARHWVPPPTLQHWLQLSHELELRNYNAKKLVAEQQLQDAKEGCEKLSRKRATFMGAFRIAHGSSIDDVDDRIVKAKSALYEVTSDLQERMHRWKQIEILCGFPIILNPGLAYLETILKGPLGGSNGSNHSGLNSLTQSSSDITLHEESPPPYAGVASACVTSSKTVDRRVKGPRQLVHRDSGISLTSGMQILPNIPSAVKNGTLPNIPPPCYSKTTTSPTGLRKISSSTTDVTSSHIPFTSSSRVVYPRECYRPADNLSSFETDLDDMQIAEMDDDSTERSVTPPSVASCPDSSKAHFTLADGASVDTTRHKSVDLEYATSSVDSHNGKANVIIRKISTGIKEKIKKPSSAAVEALKKSASSSSIAETEAASSESSTSVVATEEKQKKKKFFSHLRQKKIK